MQNAKQIIGQQAGIDTQSATTCNVSNTDNSLTYDQPTCNNKTAEIFTHPFVNQFSEATDQQQQQQLHQQPITHLKQEQVTSSTTPEADCGGAADTTNNTTTTTIYPIALSSAPGRTRMNIQPTSFTKNHLLNNGALSANDELSIRKRREDLSRRPSYRKIFNDLTGLGSPLDSQPLGPVPVPVSAPLAPGSLPVQASGPQQQQQHPATVLKSDQSSAAPPMMTNVGLHHQQQQQQQQQQQHHHHHHHPHPHQQQQHQQQHQQQQQHPSSHHSQASQLQQVHHMLNTTSPLIQDSPVGVGEEATKKRELRLQKNREAAKECRRKKKEYIKCLENRVAVLENQNKALIDELKSLKDLYCNTAKE